MLTFVTAKTDHAPARYRIAVPALGLQARGMETQVVHPASDDLLERLRGSSHVVLSRVQMSAELAEALNRARETNPDLVVAYDVDDPLFDDSFGGEQAWLHRAALEASDVMLGSTPALHEWGRRVHDVAGGGPFRNGIHPDLARRSEIARRLPRRPGPLRLGFLSGSGTHQQHWQSVEQAVAEVMEAHPRTELWTIGPVDRGPAFDQPSLDGRVCQVPFMDWTDLPFWLRQLDLVLMPNSDPELLGDTKSNIKWLEAALVGTPVMATATGPYRDALGDGTTGFAVDRDAGSWREPLGEAVRSPLRQIGKRARSRALEQYGVETVARELLDGLSKAQPRTGRRLDPQDYPAAGPAGPVGLDAARIKPRLPLRLQAEILLRGPRSAAGQPAGRAAT